MVVISVHTTACQGVSARGSNRQTVRRLCNRAAKPLQALGHCREAVALLQTYAGGIFKMGSALAIGAEYG